MSDKMTKTMKIDEETLSLLNNLKLEYKKEFPKTYLSYDYIINQLLYEHNFLNKPERKEEEKKKLLEDYVPKNDFNNVYNRRIELEDKINKLSEEHENNTKELEQELEKLKENFNLEKTASQILNLLSDFYKQWQNFKESMEKMGKRIEDAQREYLTLTTTRSKALERPLLKIDNLRASKKINLDANGKALRHQGDMKDYE